ncbi:nitrite/sulfite reductase [Desulfuromonas sp. KJ2020]|uniref:nitrite/sulfite reductase n=1 Tax=Desulfuromonas sp. KJ2020 TaxID=2919173 RepID=UPI0020A7EB52|nr:nitrite/sulfite reductase [Desulfuromonas sp. KJ2020]MCP3177746.1 nitrite/sulfite reductase [Desulfuromonas sp. KJ2020]
MNIDYQKLRLDGIYQQDQQGNLMLRIKIPAGVLSCQQAEAVSDIAAQVGTGILHLTTRGSIELHGLRHGQLAEVFRRLAAVGLSSRGACGGAVRGISCSTTFSPAFAVCQAVARNLNRHFAGNPYFEGLPKKFKIGIDGDYTGSRHLIQDVGLVWVGQDEEEQNLFDVWCAGGLGREPQAGFLLENAVPEARLIGLIEAIVAVYRDNTPPPKRLKFLLGQVGEEGFRTLLAKAMAQVATVPRQVSLAGPLTQTRGKIVEAVVFAGELTVAQFRRLAAIARDEAGGFLALTADQNVAFHLAPGANYGKVYEQLGALGLAGEAPEQRVCLRVCPGSHECRMGLSATRDVSRQLVGALSEKGRSRRYAVSGCPNSCSQVQLADVGILTSRQIKDDLGQRRPLFTLYRRQGEGLGVPVAENLSLEELLNNIQRIE